MIGRNGSTLYWAIGEELIVEFKSEGNVYPCPYNGTPKPFLGRVEFSHISKSPDFDGNKTARCEGQGDCRWCNAGFKASPQVNSVPLVFEGNSYYASIPVTLNNRIVELMSDIKRDGYDPVLFSYKIKRNGGRGRGAWDITGLMPEGIGGGMPHEDKAKPEPSDDGKLNLSDAEVSMIDAMKAILLDMGVEIDKKDEWIEALKKRGFEDNADEVYEMYVLGE